MVTETRSGSTDAELSRDCIIHGVSSSSPRPPRTVWSSGRGAGPGTASRAGGLACRGEGKVKWLCYERGHSRRVGAAALVRAAAQQLPDLARDDGVVGPLVVDDLGPAPGVLAQLAGADIAASSAGPLLFVLDEAPVQHKMLNFGLFQAKTYADGL